MIAFTRAVKVAPGDNITSREQRLFAAAINDRTLSGIGNATYRIAQYMLGLFRSMVMGADEFSVRAEDEFFAIWQSVLPNQANWPEGGVDPGSGLPEPLGPNLNNPLAAWVWGRKPNDILPESQRLMQVLVPYKSDTPAVKWAYRKQQGGAIDAITGEVISPARYLAFEHARFAFARVGLMGTSYGGFLPGPSQNLTACRPPCDPPCTLYARENLDVIFTATRPDVTADGLHFGWMDTPAPWPTDPGQTVLVGHYNGTCLPRLDDLTLYESHINYWYETPAGYIVVLNSGVTDFLPINDWIEGPYTRVAELKRGVGDQIGRAVNAFAREFRGSDGQRGDGQTYALENAFDFQRFFTSQYPLAPSYGVAGKGGGIDVKYPAWSLVGPGTWPAGTKLPCNYTGTSYSWHPGFTATHLFARSDVSAAVTVRGGAGSQSITAMLDGNVQPISALVSLHGVEVELVADLTLAADQRLDVEVNEIQEYKPTKDDLYAVLRKGGATLVGMGGGDFANPYVDGQGVDEDKAALIGDDLAQFGCIINQHEVPDISDPTAQNENAVHEAARRMSLFFRLLNRFSVLDYAVQGGDSIIWFTPHPRTGPRGDDPGYPMTNPQDDGDPTIDILAGFNVSDRDAAGFSERWVMDMWLKAGDEAESSIFRTDVFSDQLPDVNRCTFLDTSIQNEPSFTRHFNRSVNVTSGSGSIFSQTPDGYNYAQHLNWPTRWVNYSPALSVSDPDLVIKHCKSCQMYAAPLEVRKVERVTEANRDLVKVTFKGRLQNTFGETGGAPYEIARGDWVNRPDLDGWAAADVLAEPYRTAENGLRLYLLYRWGKVALPSVGVGDLALTGQTLSQSASIFPSFYFVKLMPEAALDLNDTQDATDALFQHDHMLQAEIMLRAMSEGFVAGTGSLNCSDPTNARTYDWEWPSLIQSVSGLRSLSAFATQTTSMLGASDVRPDGPEGYGPLPNTYASSEVFNNMVDAVNSLTRVRVMLPWQAQFRETDWASVVIGAGGAVDNGCGTASSCGTGGTGESMATGQRPANVGVGAWGAWGPGSSATAYTQHQVAACYGLDWGLESRRKTAQLQFEFIDWTLYQHAIPVLWRDMMGAAAGHLGAICLVDTVKNWVERRAGSTHCDGGAGGHTFPCDLHLHTITTQECRWIPSGTYTLDAGPEPLGGWAYYWNNSSAPGGGSCSGGSEIAISMYLLGDTTPVLEIPLVNAQEWEVQPWIPL